MPFLPDNPLFVAGNVQEMLQVTKTAELRDVDWASWTVPFGYAMKGVRSLMLLTYSPNLVKRFPFVAQIWPAGVDGSHINGVARSRSCDLIATGDDDCYLKLFKFPCYDSKAQYRMYSGHASHVTNVAFQPSDSHLLSTGGQDSSLLVWKVIRGDSAIASEKSPSVVPKSGSVFLSPSSSADSLSASSTLDQLVQRGAISDRVAAAARDILEGESIKERLIALLRSGQDDVAAEISRLLEQSL